MERHDRRIDRDLAHVARLQNALLCSTGFLWNMFLNPGDPERFSRQALEDMIEMAQFLLVHSARLAMKTRAMVAHNRRRWFLSITKASLGQGLPVNVKRQLDEQPRGICSQPISWPLSLPRHNKSYQKANISAVRASCGSCRKGKKRSRSRPRRMGAWTSDCPKNVHMNRLGTWVISTQAGSRHLYVLR